MTNNEERIWDVLIEDALRESGAPAPMHEMGDRTRRLLQPLGPIGVDRGRSMRYTRGRWVRITAGMLAVVLVLTILYLGVALLPMLSEANREQPQSAESNQSPVRQDGGESSSPASDQPPKKSEQPEDAPEPKPEETPEQPEPKPEDTVEQPESKPEDTGEQPKPEPKPEDTVEQPKPEPKPEDTVEQPKPEPKPEDTVEQPKQPEETTPEPDSKLRINLLTEIDWQKPGLKMFDYSSDGKIWAHAEKLTHFAGNVWLRTRTGIDFEAGGVLLRLNGTMRVTLNEEELGIELQDDELFVDSRGADRGVSLTASEHSLSLISCAIYLEQKSSGVTVSVYEGEVKIGDELISGPKSGKLDKRQRPRFGALKGTMEQEPFLLGLKQRVVYRENFDADPKGRLREGTLKDGVISGGKVFWGYPENIQHETGLVIRMRVRFTNAEGATLTQFAIPRNDNFSFELGTERLKPGEWQVLEVPVDQLIERTTHKEHPNEVDWFQNVSITTQGENAQVELDWVELIRAVK